MTIILITGCASSKIPEKELITFDDIQCAYYEKPEDLFDSVLYSKSITEYSEFLIGKKIFLDPGHGGQDRKNISPNGKVVEADINLIVAKYLTGFLEHAGAEVELSRASDETVSLEDRALLANKSKTDFFISIHHNSTEDTTRNWVNYTAAFYHANPGDYEYDYFEHSLARYIQRDLSYTLRNSGGLGSFDGTYSDYLIKPNEGFYVLREVKIPAVLIECSFFTSRLEQQRLQIEEFNKIEAWGIFKGIANFLKTGYPLLTLNQVRSVKINDNLKLIVDVDSKKNINTNSIKVLLNKDEINYIFDEKNKSLEINLNDAAPGKYELRIILSDEENMFNYPFTRQIIIK